MKTLISTLILGAGLTFGIAGNVNGQDTIVKQKKGFPITAKYFFEPMPIPSSNSCEIKLHNEFLSNRILHPYDSTQKGSGNKIYEGFLPNQSMYVSYREDIPYTNCSGKESFLNMLEIIRYEDNKLIDRILIDNERDSVYHAFRENIPKTEKGEYFCGEGLDGRVEYILEFRDKDDSRRLIKKIPKYEEIAKYSEFYDIKMIDKYSELYNDVRELIINEKNKQLTNKK